MGARAVIGITHPDSDTPIYLYTHWCGDSIRRILADGLVKARDAGRLADYPYATRIIFDTLTGLEGGSTGFGINIGTYPSDVEYEIPHVIWADWGSEPVVNYMGQTHPASTFIVAFRSFTEDEIRELSA